MSRYLKQTLMVFTGRSGSGVIQMMAGFLLVVIYLKVLGSELYGLWLATGGVLSMMGLMDFGLSSLIAVKAGEAIHHKDKSRVRAALMSGLFVQLLLALVLLFILAPCITFILPDILNMDASRQELLQGCFLLAALALAIRLPVNGLMRFCETRQSAQSIAWAQFAAVLADTLTKVLCLLAGWGLWALPLGRLAHVLCVAVVSGWKTREILKEYPGRGHAISRESLRGYWKLSPVLISSRSLRSLVQNSEPTLITAFLGPHVTTVYVITRKAATLIQQFLQTAGNSTLPALAHKAGALENKGALPGDWVPLFLKGTLFMMLIYSLHNPAFVKIWVGQSLYGGDFLTVGCAWAVTGIALQNLASYFCLAKGEIRKEAGVSMIENMCRFLLMLLSLNYFPLWVFPFCVGLSSLTGGVWLLKKQIFTSLTAKGIYWDIAAVGCIIFISMVFSDKSNFLFWLSLAGSCFVLLAWIYFTQKNIVLTLFRKPVTPF